MTQYMQNFLVDLAMLVKKYDVRIFTDDISAITIFQDQDSNVYLPDGKIDIATLADILDKAENPDRHHIEANDINQIDLTLDGKDFIDTPKLQYVWYPKDASIDSGHLSFDVSRGDLYINIVIRKHGFMETIFDFVQVPVNSVIDKKFRIFVKDNKINTELA